MELGQLMFGNHTEEYAVPRFVGNDLFSLHEEIIEDHPEMAAYGIEFSNQVFETFPYYWGECDCGFDTKDREWYEANQHSENCYQSVLRQRYITAGSVPDDTGWVSPPSGADKIREALCKEMSLPYPDGSAIHCTCRYQADYAKWRKDNNHSTKCLTVKPNFLHKASGYEVRWYKYIGRGMSANREITRDQWREIFRACQDSLTTRT